MPFQQGVKECIIYAMKLGEALIKHGLMTKEQLNQALERQVVFGGRIGTNILELRILNEKELTKFLSKYFRIPEVEPEMIASIPEEVVSSINNEVVEKYKILPFKKDRNRLHTAMLNPKDMKEIDELRFVTGFDIIPYVITELRLVHAIEKYYGIKRDVRYISLIDRFNPETKVEESSINKIKAAFADVKEAEEIAGILMNEAYKIAERVAVFNVRGGKIMGWKARGIDMEGFSVSDKEFSIFSEAVKNGNYRGPMVNIKGNEPLIKILSGRPNDALLMPVNIREKPVAFLYVDNGNEAVLNANVGYLSKLAAMAALAFELLIIRKKILDM